MKDLIVIVMTLAFFALAVGYVALCNRIIGPDAVDDAGTAEGSVDDGDIGGDAEDRLGAQEVPA
jgi:hypothetical protein